MSISIKIFVIDPTMRTRCFWPNGSRKSWRLSSAVRVRLPLQLSGHCSTVHSG